MKEKFSISFLRHGETDYIEDRRRDVGETMDFWEVDLTDLGVKQAKMVAEKIANEIDPDSEEVLFYGSPSKRAQDTEDIIKEELIKKDIKIIKKKISHTLSPIKKKNNYENEKEEIRDNAMRFMKWVSFMAKKCKVEDKKIRVISVSHHEFLTPIMENIFKFDIHHGEGYKKTEVMKLLFKYDNKNDVVLINAEMRDKKVENLFFDAITKQFLIYDSNP